MKETFCMECGEELDEDGRCSTHGNYADEYKYCPYCGIKYGYEDIITGREYEEFWGAPCSYEVVIGVECHNCGMRIEV